MSTTHFFLFFVPFGVADFVDTLGSALWMGFGRNTPVATRDVVLVVLLVLVLVVCGGLGSVWC